MFGKQYTAEELRQIIGAKEDEKIEFKTSLPPDTIIANNLAALANTSGGYLVIGVSDDGKMVGISPEEAFKARDRISFIASSLMPGRIRDVTVTTIGDRALVLADVSPPDTNDPPIITSDGRILRRHRSSIVLDENARARFFATAIDKKPTRKKRFIVFVAMSFRIEEHPELADYGKAIERAAKRSNVSIKIRRIDEKEGDFEISQEVMNQIDQADLLLADYTYSPHNVYFEAGYARGKSKPLIQTARKDTVLEFDIRNWRTLFYRNATELEELLVKTFNALGQPAN
jgi:predicted HTH transcriptional regulator